MKEYDENEISRAEQEKISQHEEKIQADERAKEQQNHEKERLDKDRQSEDNRLADERQKEYDRNQEEIRKDSEKRRKKQKDKKLSIAGKGSDLGTVTIDIAEKTVDSIKDSLKDIKRMAENLREQKYEKELSKEKEFPKTNCNNSIQEYDTLKGKADTLDKLNKSITETKDKGLLKKYQTTKQNLENDIARDYGISKENPKMFQSNDRKQQLEKDYRGKLQDELKNLSIGKERAVKNLVEQRGRMVENMEQNRITSKDKSQEHEKTQIHTPSRSR